LWVQGKEGLHCGQILDVFINGEWVNDTLEMKNDGTWYLVDNNQYYGNSLEGLKVRFEN